MILFEYLKNIRDIIQFDFYQKLFLTIFFVFTLSMFGLAIIGGIKSYSPVPFWDMWDGGIGFFLTHRSGDYTVWWSQHNEHRIVIERLLIFIDLKYFGGKSIFLVIMNYVFAGLSVLFFLRILRLTSATELPTVAEKFIGLVFLNSLFCWFQSENFREPFQGQFFLAYLIPLVTFYFLYLATLEPYKWFYFILASILGIMSVGTMANGVLILPLMAVYLIIAKQDIKKIIIIALCSMLFCNLFMFNYTSPSGHGTLLSSLQDHPFLLINYFFAFLGNIYYWFFKDESLAIKAGLFFFCNVLYFSTDYIFSTKRDNLKLALLFFIFYIILSAFLIAGGRSPFGISQAFAGRYTTPIIMAWLALLVLYLPFFEKIMKNINSCIFGGMFLLFFCFSIYKVQIAALQSHADELFERKVALLALKLNINDPSQITRLYPSFSRLNQLMNQAKMQNITLFDFYPYSQVFESVKKPKKVTNNLNCKNIFISLNKDINDEKFIGLSGTQNITRNKFSELIYFLGRKNTIIGWALSNKQDSKTIFKGYLRRSFIDNEVILLDKDTKCKIPIINSV